MVEANVSPATGAFCRMARPVHPQSDLAPPVPAAGDGGLAETGWTLVPPPARDRPLADRRLLSERRLTFSAPADHGEPTHFRRRRGTAAIQQSTPHVWLVDSQPDHEIYSSGLRIETAHVVRNEPRAWKRLNLANNELERGGGPPVGIVYHSTESHIAPFEPAENLRLQRAGESVLDLVARNRSYHYLIDRFGRVHRVVDERDAAWHAGTSVWGDDAQAWLNLNHGFLGISLEAATAGEKGDRDPITPGQIHALKTLTAMLRSRYSIPAERCVTHAQVSIKLSNRLLGHHADWASGFPFAAIGLPDNYSLPLVSMTAFGFSSDSDFLDKGAAGMDRPRPLGKANQAAGCRFRQFGTGVPYAASRKI